MKFRWKSTRFLRISVQFSICYYWYRMILFVISVFYNYIHRSLIFPEHCYLLYILNNCPCFQITTNNFGVLFLAASIRWSLPNLHRNTNWPWNALTRSLTVSTPKTRSEMVTVVGHLESRRSWVDHHSVFLYDIKSFRPMNAIREIASKCKIFFFLYSITI